MTKDALNSEQQLLELWLEEVNQNPRFKDESLPQNSNLKNYSKSFLQQLFTAVKSPDMPELTSDTM
eukprot:COSAG01_NODE_5038_length_4532_cov_1.902323_1_plen_65_part_10